MGAAEKRKRGSSGFALPGRGRSVRERAVSQARLFFGFVLRSKRTLAYLFPFR